jgi:imidazolonepropionase-like amidohydrolase
VIRALAALAIAGATVWTGDGPPLENATVLIEGARVVKVGRDVAIPAGAVRIDAAGQVVTPGLIDPATRLGLEDVQLEPAAVEGTAGSAADPVRAALRTGDTFNPASFAIPIARAGGLTAAAVLPAGGLVEGQSAWVHLVEEDAVRRSPLALHVSLLAHGDEGGSRARAFLRLREALEDARLYRANRGPYIANRLRELSVSSADLATLEQALARELPVVLEVDRAADIRTALALVREHALRAVLLGAAEGWKVAAEIARARVPVLLDPTENLPETFDKLQGRGDNALLLERAGVRVAFTGRGSAQLAHRLRHLAGNAVAGGYPRDAALAAITRLPAEIFGIADEGVLRPGALANVVVWNGDPLEVSSWAVRMFVRGHEVDLRTRQDLLTERYLRGAAPAPATP